MATYREILRHRSLVIIGLAESISGVGNWLTMLAILAIVVFRGGGNIVASSGIFLAGLLPTLLMSPFAGWLVDRVERRLLMAVSQLLSGLAVAGLIFARSLPHIYTLVAAESALLAVMTPARQAVVPEIIPRDDLARANAFLQQLTGLIKITGPVLAGLVISAFGPRAAIIIDVVSFAVAGLILWGLPAFPPHLDAASATGAERTTQPRGPKVRGVLRRSRQLQMLFILTFLGIFIIIGFDALSPVYTRDVLQGRENLFGLLVGLIGLGTLGASAAILFTREKTDPWQGLLLGAVLLTGIPAFLGLAAMAPDPAIARFLAAAGCLIGGAGVGLLSIESGTVLQLQSPPACLGRLGGLFQSTATAGQLAGLMVTPLLVPAVLPVGAYFGLATVMMIALILSALLSSRLRSSVASPRAKESDRGLPNGISSQMTER